MRLLLRCIGFQQDTNRLLSCVKALAQTGFQACWNHSGDDAMTSARMCEDHLPNEMFGKFRFGGCREELVPRKLVEMLGSRRDMNQQWDQRLVQSNGLSRGLISLHCHRLTQAPGSMGLADEAGDARLHAQTESETCPAANRTGDRVDACLMATPASW